MIFVLRHTCFPFFAALLCTLLALAGCRPQKIKTTAQPPEEKTGFYTLRLTKDTVKQKLEAELKQLTVVNSRLRYLPDEAKTKEPYFLKIEVAYKNKQVVQAYTEHPLYKRLDLYQESGQIESKLISLPQGEVMLRIPYFDAYTTIRIQEVVNHKEGQTLVLKHEK